MKNKKIVIISSVIALVIIFTMLVSYAYWRVKQIQSGFNKIKGSCLSILLSEPENDGFTLENSWPITDEDGSHLIGYRFIVQNLCEEDLTYQVILDELETENDMNTEYVKIELDDRAIRRYGRLEDAIVEDIDYLPISSKKIYTGIIPKKENDIDGEVSHTLKIWISSDSPSIEKGKDFKSRVRVIAGQKIEPSEGLTLQKVNQNEEIDATINNLSEGDLVRYGTEEFYVIGTEENNIKLLSRYLINIGEHINPNVPEGLQSAELGRTRQKVDDRNTATSYYDESTHIMYGVVPFSRNAYWWNGSIYSGTWISPYTVNSFVYNSQASISNYVNGYVETLQEMGLDVTNGSLISVQDFEVLCNSDNISNNYDYGQCPNYLFETQYWLGSVFDNTYLKIANTNGGLGSVSYDYDNSVGLRPVITILLS